MERAGIVLILVGFGCQARVAPPQSKARVEAKTPRAQYHDFVAVSGTLHDSRGVDNVFIVDATPARVRVPRSGPIHGRKLAIELSLGDGHSVSAFSKPAPSIPQPFALGLGLYASATTPIYLDRGWKQVGVLYTNAFAYVYEFVPGDEWVRLALKDFKKFNSLDVKDNDGGGLLVWAKIEDLTSSIPTKAPQQMVWRHPSNHLVDISHAPDRKVPFTKTVCGPTVFYHRDSLTRVRQLVNGTEIRGWYHKAPPSGQGPIANGCQTRTMLFGKLSQQGQGGAVADYSPWMVTKQIVSILDSDGAVIGSLPANSVALSDGPKRWFRVGNVRVRTAASPEALRRFRVGDTSPRAPYPSTSVNWQPAIDWQTIDRGAVSRRLERTLLRRGAKFWRKTKAGVCVSLTVSMVARQKGAPERYEFQTNRIEDLGRGFKRRYSLGFTGNLDTGSLNLSFYSVDHIAPLGRHGRGVLGGGAHRDRYQVVKVANGRVDIVQGNGASKYAREDVVSIYSRKRTCRKARAAIFDIPHRLPELEKR